eukprot:jgi/Mesen1/6937/ME000036S06264
MTEAGDYGRVAFIGLGAMGGGMAAALVRKGYSVAGFDVSEAALDRLAAAGGTPAVTPAQASEGARALVIMVATAQQAEDVLFGPSGAAPGLRSGAVVLLCSTVPPTYARSLHQRLSGAGVEVVDAPVSGGTARAAAASLTVSLPPSLPACFSVSLSPSLHVSVSCTFSLSLSLPLECSPCLLYLLSLRHMEVVSPPLPLPLPLPLLLLLLRHRRSRCCTNRRTMRGSNPSRMLLQFLSIRYTHAARTFSRSLGQE